MDFNTNKMEKWATFGTEHGLVKEINCYNELFTSI